MDRTTSARFRPLDALGLVAVFVVAGCAGAGASPTVPPPSAMVEHSAMPNESAMAEHSAVPTTAGPVSSGAFHDVDGTASGMVFLFHLPDGSFVITFEAFSIASIAHTNVTLVTNKDVTKDGDIDKGAILDLGPLKGTSGMQDFPVPASADTMTYHTIVLWDTEMAHAIAAAPLQ